MWFPYADNFEVHLMDQNGIFRGIIPRALSHDDDVVWRLTPEGIKALQDAGWRAMWAHPDTVGWVVGVKPAR
jgi:hypothetical protein